MDNMNFKNIIKIYSERLEKYGVSQKTLGWDKNRGDLRFEILNSRWDLNHSSILDFGCGFGDFYNFLINKGIKNFKYLGIDVNEDLIKQARQKYKKAEFKCINIFEEDLPNKYDYIFASGCFNDQMNENISFIKTAFEKFNLYSKKGFGANFLSSKAQYKYKHAFYSDPSFITGLCYKYSNNVILRNDYMPFEFSVFVDKSMEYNRKLAVYNNFLNLNSSV